MTPFLGPLLGGPLTLLALANGSSASQPSPEQNTMTKSVTGAAVQASNDFAVDLYRVLAGEKPDANVFFSPFSLTSALAMTAEGARRETAAEMGTVLRLPSHLRRAGEDAQQIPWNFGPLHAGISELNRSLVGTDEATTAATRRRIAALKERLAASNAKAAEAGRQDKWEERSRAAAESRQIAAELGGLLEQVDRYEIRIANALWGDQAYPFREEFLATVAKYYGTGGVSSVDFRTQAEATRLRINRWVAQQTGERIQELIPTGMLTALTRLVLTNAIYFKGEWSEPFAEADTKPRDFTLADGTTRKVPLMDGRGCGSARYAAFNGDGSFFVTPGELPVERDPKAGADQTGRPAAPRTYPAEDGFAMVELPYKGGELALVLIAPFRAGGLPQIERRLSAKVLRQWIDRLERRAVDVLLPRFTLETDYSLNGPLARLGMERAFTQPSLPRGAQFDGMVSSRDPLERLYVTAVLHKAFLEVNEKGTEAAAATAVIMAAEAGPPTTRPFTPTFRADRPFILLIRDTASGTILFLGRVTHPD